MPQYLTPGVYVEEVPGSPPIVGVGTSTAGFIGEVKATVRMPSELGYPVEPESTAKFVEIAKDDEIIKKLDSKVLADTLREAISAKATDPNDPKIPDAASAQVSVVKNGERWAIDVDNVTYTTKLQGDKLEVYITDRRRKVVAVHVAIPISSFDQFKVNFGDFQTGNEVLAHAVYGFFLNGGSNCFVSRVDDLTNATDVATSLTAFEKIDEIAIVAAPGALDPAIQLQIMEHCERLQDRFAILDGQRTTTITVASIQGTVRDSNYAAMYFPWIKVTNPLFDPAVATSTRQTIVPPSGHMAGIYSRVDETRGVHKAPANEVVRGALDLEYLTSHNEQKLLNPKGINVIRGFNGNLKVWGARTLGGDDNGETKYINVRRVLNFLRESIDEGTQFAVFEPNSPPLWQKITRSVSGFLNLVWRDGALFGDTAKDAFYVRCDANTNPTDVRDAGQVITEIGVAIVRPAEFVIFRISQISGPIA